MTICTLHIDIQLDCHACIDRLMHEAHLLQHVDGRCPQDCTACSQEQAANAAIHEAFSYLPH